MVERKDYLELQESELSHYEQQYRSEMTAYDLDPQTVKDELDSLKDKIDFARVKLEELRNATDDADWHAKSAEYKAVRDEVREALKKIDREHDQGGPPLE